MAMSYLDYRVKHRQHQNERGEGKPEAPATGRQAGGSSPASSDASTPKKSSSGSSFLDYKVKNRKKEVKANGYERYGTYTYKPQKPDPVPVSPLENLAAQKVANDRARSTSVPNDPVSLQRFMGVQGGIQRSNGVNQTIGNMRDDVEILRGEPKNLTREGQWAARHPYAGTVMYGAANLVGGGEGVVNTLEAAARAAINNEKMDPNAIKAAPIAQAFRTGAAEGFRRGFENGVTAPIAQAAGISSDDGRYSRGEQVMDFLTGVAADAASSTMGMLTGGGASTYLMGANAANQSLYDTATDENTTARQALALATANGAAEAFFEKFSIENFDAMRISSPTNAREYLKAALKSAGIEASEETFTEIANTLSDVLIRGGNSELGQEYNSYIAQGMDPNEAASNTLGTAVKNIALAGLGGALSGGLHTGVALGMNTIQGGAQMRQDVQRGNVDLAEIAEGADTSTREGQRMQELANDLIQRQEAGEKVSTLQYGALNNAVENAVETDTQRGVEPSYRNAVEQEEQEIIDRDAAKELSRGFGEEGARAFQEIAPEQAVDSYRDFTEYYNHMRFGTALRENMETNLTQEQISAAMKAGAADANAAYPQETVRAANKAVNMVNLENIKAGNVDTSGINYNNLTQGQKLRVDYAGALVSKAFGMDVRFVQSKAENGAYKGMNGSFQGINGSPTITLDVNAGMNLESDWTGDLTDIQTMLPVISHEVTHSLEKSNPELYRQLSNAVIQALAGSATYTEGGTINEVIRAERNRMDRMEFDADGNAIRHTDADAIHEIVARACEDFLSGDEKAVQVFENLDADTKKTLWDHVKEVFDNIKEFFTQMLSNYKSNSKEAQAIRQNMEEYERIRGIWQEALDNGTVVHASEMSTDAAAEATDGTMAGEFSIRQFAQALDLDVRLTGEGQAFEIIDPNTGKAITEVTDEMMEKTPMGFMVRSAQSAGTISKETADKQIGMFKDLMNLTLRYDKGSTPMVWEIAGTFLYSSVKTNSDKQYSTTVDYGTICSKTQALIDVLSKTMVEKGRGLTREEVIKAYNETAKTGLSVPCPVCYVFSRWMGVPSLLETMRKCQDRFTNASEAEVQSYIKSMLDEYGDAKGVNSEKTKVQNRLATLERKLQEALQANDTAEQAKIQKEVGELEKKMRDLESFNWVTQVRCVKTKNGGYKLDNKYKPVPNDILLDLTRSGDFAQQFPKSWKYRTTRGAGMGKAIMPYSGATLGDFIKGTKDRWTKAKNPFYAKSEKSAKAAIVRAQTRVRGQNLIGGQRFQSTSDFRAEWGIDYLMTFLECQAAGSQVQLYTKVVEAVDMFASAGAEVNLSIMPKDNGHENGKLVFSDVTGVNFERALEKTRMYDNVQMILVGINDDHIRLAMADDRITFIIPWHSSGNSKDTLAQLMGAVGEKLDVSKNTDYSDFQNDKVIDNSDRMKAIRAFRKEIIQGKLWGNYKTKTAKSLTAEQQSMLDSNPYLKELYRKFYQDTSAKEYGVRLNGNQSASIFPYEYWDTSLTIKDADQNGRRFQEYCASIGIQPRFQQFANDTGYWKLLIDRRMYNRDGTYHAPQAIDVTNVSIEQVPQAVNSNNYKDADKINQATLDTIRAIDDRPSDLTVTEDVALTTENEAQETPAEIDDYNESSPSMAVDSGVQYSMRDSEYMSAVESDDTDTADRLVEEAAKEAGYTVRAYHGTPTGGFTKFVTDNVINGREFGDGIYFSSSREAAQNFTTATGRTKGTINPMVYDTYLNLGDNVLTIDYDELRKQYKGRTALINYEVKDMIKKQGPDASAIVIKGVYDGSDIKATNYIVKASSQAKSAETVVYDDDGNVIPLSERFNRENDDIRYSQRGVDMSEELAASREQMDERYLARMADVIAEKDAEIERLKAKMDKAVGAEKEKAKERLEKLRKDKNDRIAYLEKSYKANLDWRIAEMRQRMDKMKDASAEEKQKARERLNKLRAQKDQKIEDILQKNREQRLKRREKKAMQELLRRARRLMGESRKGSPEFKAQVDALIGDLDLAAAGIRDNTRAKLEELRKQVDAQSKLDPDYAKYEAPKYAELLSRIDPSKRHIKDMSIDEITRLTEAIVALEHSKQTADREIKEGQGRLFGHYGKLAVEQQKMAKGINHNNEIGAQLGKYRLNMLAPLRGFALIDGYQRDGVFSYFGKQLNDGQTKAAQFRMEVEKMFHDIDQNKELIDDFAKQNIEIDTMEGKKKISKGMRIALYLHLQNMDNVKHIAFGGITIPNETLYKRGKYKEAYAAGDTVHLSEWIPGALGENVLSEANRKNDAMAAAAIRKITDQMTPEEKEYAKIAQEFFNVKTKNAINEVSLELNGYEKATVDDYFPICTDKNYLASNFDGLVQNGTLEGVGFLKERIGSRLPIYLEDVSQVVLRQKNNTAQYYGLAIPVRNFSRFYSYVGGKRLERNVKKAVGNTWKQAGLDYIDHVLNDLQFGRQTQRTITDRLKSVYAGTTLNFNLGVAIKQSASYPFAASVIGWEPLIKAARHVVSKADREYMDSITPWGYMRRTGFSGTEMGEVAKQRTGIDNNRTIQKVKSALDLIRRVDVKTTEVLFFACEEYVKEHYPDLEVRGKEYNQKLAEIYNETLQRTQPSYDVMQRNEFLRAQNDIAKIFGAFKTQTFNMGGEVIDAWGRWRATSEYAKTDSSYKNAAKDAGKAFGNTIAATLVAQGMLVILTAAANAVLHKMRDYRDEKGEVTPESVATKILKDFGTSFAGLTMGGSEVQDFALALLGDGNWYEIDYPGLSLINEFASAAADLKKAINKAVDTGKEEDMDKASQKVARVLMQMFKLGGVPTQNVYNIANMFNLWGQDIKNGEAGSFDAGMGLFGLYNTTPTKEQYARRAVFYSEREEPDKVSKALQGTNKANLEKVLHLKLTKNLYDSFLDDPENLAKFLNVKQGLSGPSLTDVPDEGYPSFVKLREAIGDPERTQNWHHIVEQEQMDEGLSGFKSTQVNNKNNIVSVPSGSKSPHGEISKYYGSVQDFTGGKTVREWLSTKSFEEQFNFGVKQLQKYGDIVPTSNGWVFVPDEEKIETGIPMTKGKVDERTNTQKQWDTMLAEAREDKSLKGREVREAALKLLKDGVAEEEVSELYLKKDKKYGSWEGSLEDYIKGRDAMEDAKLIKDTELKKQSVRSYLDNYQGSYGDELILWKLAGFGESTFDYQ